MIYIECILTNVLHLDVICLQLILDEVKSHEPEHKALNFASTVHLKNAEDKDVTSHVPVIEDEVATINRQYDELHCEVNKKLDLLSDAQESLHGFQETLHVVEQTLEEVEMFVVEKYMLILDLKQAEKELGKAKVSCVLCAFASLAIH